jgi:trigger factor
MEKAFSEIQKKAKIQGFRVGKAPLHLVKRTYGDLMKEQVMRNLYEETLYKALDDNKIDPVEKPVIEFEPVEKDAPFKYTILAEVMPEIELKDYIGLQITKEKFNLNPENVENEIKRMQESMAQLVPLDETAAVASGHTASVDYDFTLEGFPEESSSATDAVIEVGANKLLPGFEEQIIGMKLGETREIRVTMPEGHRNPEVVGKEGVFKIILKELKRKELPELDDDFAQQYGEHETMTELRQKLQEYQQKHEQERIENDLKDKVIQALIEKNPLEVPQSMVKRQLDYMLENLKNRLKSQQMSIEMMGLDDEGFRLRFQSEAEQKVKGGLLLMNLVNKENIKVEESDLTVKYEKIASGNPEMLGRVIEFYSGNQKARQSLSSEIQEDKAISFLLDKAVITEVEAVEQQPEQV